MFIRFARTKAVAMFLKREGTGLLAQLNLLFELLRIWGDLGARRAVIKQVAEQKGSGDDTRYREIIRTSFFLNIAASGTLALAVIALSPQISKWLFGNAGNAPYVAAIAMILPISSFTTLIACVIKGNLLYAPYVKYTIIAYAGVVLTVPLIFFWGIWGAFFVLLAFFAFPLIGYLLLNRKERFLRLSDGISTGVMKEQLSYGAMDIYGITLSTLSRLAVATMITKSLGLAATGLYQVVLAFSTVYLAVLIQAVTGYTLPSVAAAKTREEGFSAVNDTIRFLTFVISPIVVSLIIFPEFYIYFFYDRSFYSAALPLQIQLIGTMFQIVTAAFSPYLVAHSKFRALLTSSTATPIVFMGGSFLMYRHWGLLGVSASFVISAAVAMGIEYGFCRRYFAMRINPKNIRLLAATAVWILYALLVGIGSANLWVRMSAILAGVAWFFFSSKDHEREFLSQRVKRIWPRSAAPEKVPA